MIVGGRRKLSSFFCFAAVIICCGTAGSSRRLASSDDATALLSFKRSSIQSDPNGALSSWVAGNGSPCGWWGVTCSSSSAVTGIDLSGAGLTGSLHLPDLIALTGLRSVYLQGNKFTAGNLSVGTAVPCLLQSIDLSSNNFSDPLPGSSFLGSCGQLMYANLSGNSIPGGSFQFGPSLLQLDLSSNLISDVALLNTSLANCQNLNLLDFSNNRLTGKLEATPSNCKNLTYIDVSGNNISSSLPSRFVADSLSLVYLDLSRNNFSGDFSSLDFGSCGNLAVLNMSQNGFFGTDFPTSLKNCQFLKTLDLSRNELQSTIPGTLLGGLKNLLKLHLSRNHLMGQIQTELAQSCRTLQELDLSSNNLSGELPAAFASCSSLYSLNLGNNHLYGDFPGSVIWNLTSLNHLYLPFNNFTGMMPQSMSKFTQLQTLDLSSNAITGSVPSDICSSSSSHPLEKLLLPNNYLSGTVPSALGLCKNLKAIDLSFNNLNGEIPKEIWFLPNIADLAMWANNLTGKIPEGICVNGGMLETLILNNNLISGSLPESITNCTNMIWVSLSSNSLTGIIPRGMGNLRSLAILQLGNNSLTGEIPADLGNCESLIWLDLNSNQLTGPVPPALANQAGQVIQGGISGKQFAFVRNEGGTACRGAGGLVEFQGIRPARLENFPNVHSCPTTRIYTGSTVYTFAHNGSLIYLDLSYNDLLGMIPDNYGSMGYLQVLNLGHNGLTGQIPVSFGGLKLLGVLDVSHNHLDGPIPGALGSLNFLNDLDVSNNNLSGPIPTGGQLTTFPAARFENNSGLCGLPLPPCGSGGPRTANSRNRDKKQSFEAVMVIGVAFFLTCIVGLMFSLYRVKKSQKVELQREKYVESLPTSGSGSWKLSSIHEPLSINVATFEKPLRKLTFAHLLEATNGFSAKSLIGSGGFGEVYKAKLKDGNIVAIKKLIHATSQGDREFMAEMETIGKIKHRNLVPLMGYCKVGEERLLVYEFMKWGSLESVLHDKAKGGLVRLDWTTRKKIAIGAARGLAFLHHSCIPHIIHRDMKSSNVLLDENLEARVSDFGMARLVNALDTHLSVSTLAGTPGYVPPEYYQSFRCTTKGDVYSYGVVMLELLSRKRPIDTAEFGDDNNLVGWAKQLQKEKKLNSILDPELIMTKSGEAELYHYLTVAFQCLDDRPLRRPTMIQVMAMFKELQVNSESDMLDGLSLKDGTIDESREKDPWLNGLPAAG
ncbi:hypothetical protein MLD38_024870 [Melastoma candidum]|uniref:Uncharacterized protein n=1 Tax=Melastoma candidum TaxID=119954 RepID=A0ACB9NTC4_9MYRT|nr:hypothetical protein MLD38_024870 [Melastoma candidum]